jgi:hypothetical protein
MSGNPHPRREGSGRWARTGDQDQHDAVVSAAWMAQGVIDVRDELQITA